MFSKKLYDAIFKSKSGFYSVVTALAVLLAVVQLGMIVYLNFFKLRYHLDADASINFLRELEAYSPLFANGGVTATTGSGEGLFSFLTKYKLMLFGGDVFLYHAVKNTLVTFTSVVLFGQLFRKLGVKALSGILVINLLLCPYITLNINVNNDLGYFANMFVSSGYYGKRTIIELLIIYNVFDLIKGKFNWPLLAVGAVYMFHYGMATGIYEILNILGPMLLFCIIYAMIKNDAKLLIGKHSIYIIICTVLLFAAKLFTNKSGSSAIDESLSFVHMENLWENIGSVINGFANLLGAFTVRQNVSLMSLTGIQYIVNFVILMIFAASFVYYLYRLFTKSEAAVKYLPFFCVCAVVFIGHCLTNAPLGNEVFIRAQRYMLPAMISGLFLICFMVEDIKDEQLFKKFGALVLVGTAAFSSISSYKVYNDREIPFDSVKSIIEQIEAADVPVVYGWGETYAFGTSNPSLMAMNMRVYDHTRVYRSLYNSYNTADTFGDYEYYLDASDAAGSSVIMSVENDYNTLPEFIKNKYTLMYTEPATGVNLYYSETNPFDLTSGIGAEDNKDYMYSEGITVGCGSLDANGFIVSDGTEGMLMQYRPTKKGVINTYPGRYDITLKYSVADYAGTESAIFNVTSGAEKQITSSVALEKGSTSVTVKDVVIGYNGQEIGCNVSIPAGAQISLESIHIDYIGN